MHNKPATMANENQYPVDHCKTDCLND